MLKIFMLSFSIFNTSIVPFLLSNLKNSLNSIESPFRIVRRVCHFKEVSPRKVEQTHRFYCPKGGEKMLFEHLSQILTCLLYFGLKSEPSGSDNCNTNLEYHYIPFFS